MRCSALDRIAAGVVESNAAPAASCAVAFRDRGTWRFGVGAAGTLWPNSSVPTTPDTLFDLASLTKPVVAVAAATESTCGGLDWSVPINSYLPELAGWETGKSTIDQLLSHRAGLVPHLELFRSHKAGQAFTIARLLSIVARAGRSSSGVTASPEGTAVYSDLGYILVGAAIERIARLRLDDWLSWRLTPIVESGLGSARWWYARDSQFRSRCAPTENLPWRGGVLRGRVHDENAWALGGFGLSGHAGLFGTALAVAEFGAAVLDATCFGGGPLPAAAVELTTRRRPGGAHCAGFERRSPEGSMAGQLASTETFGHLGFTGTSLWCDPCRPAVVVFLSNRVCPTRCNPALRVLRPTIHDMLFRWADRASSTGRSAESAFNSV